MSKEYEDYLKKLYEELREQEKDKKVEYTSFNDFHDYYSPLVDWPPIERMRLLEETEIFPAASFTCEVSDEDRDISIGSASMEDAICLAADLIINMVKE